MTNREKHGYKALPLCDTHVHPIMIRPLDGSFETLRDTIDYYEYSRITMCCLTNSTHGDDPMDNLKGIYLKDALNTHYGEERAFVYGSPFHHRDERDTAAGYRRQVEDMYEWGMDGYKILDGKPEWRVKLGKPLCDPIFDPMYAFIEEMGMPVKMHLGDPAYFWGDKSLMHEYGLQHGWWYGGGGYPSLTELREEVDGILRKFPKLKLCLAHFYFLGDQPEELRRFFESWENVSVDLTPGAIMFAGMTEQYETYQRFYEDYSDRIFFGTDTYNTAIPGEGLERYEVSPIIRANLVRRMLEWGPEDAFEIPHMNTTCVVKPLQLADWQLKNIYFENHRRLHPAARPLNRAAIRRGLEAFDMGLIPPDYLPTEEPNRAQMMAHFAR